MRKTWVVILIALAILSSWFIHQYGWDRLRGRISEIPASELSDGIWVLLLCSFSLLTRLRKKQKRFRLYLLLAATSLLLLATFHSHALWSLSPSIGRKTDTRLSRIFTVEANPFKTSIKADEWIRSMTFDSKGRLWFSSGNETVRIADTATNTVVELLAPVPVRGLYGDEEGMWALTAAGAYFYRGDEPSERIVFPNGAVPLTALRWKGNLYFGTTDGLYQSGERNPRLIGAPMRVTQLVPYQNVLLAVNENEIRQLRDGQLTSFSQLGIDTHLYGLVNSAGEIIASTDNDGLLLYQQTKWTPIVFARATLNMLVPGAGTVFHGTPVFGTMEGSLIFKQSGRWNRISIGSSPITSLATDGTSLYVWCSGELYTLNSLCSSCSRRS